jgi:hypothetical protein
MLKLLTMQLNKKKANNKKKSIGFKRITADKSIWVHDGTEKHAPFI